MQLLRMMASILWVARLASGEVESFDDHRIAMAFSIAALRANGPITIKETYNVATHLFPNFISLARQVGINIKLA